MDLNDGKLLGQPLSRSAMTPIERAQGRYLRAPDHDAGTGGGEDGSGSADDLLGGAGDGGEGGVGGQGDESDADGGGGGDDDASGEGGDAAFLETLSAEGEGEEPSLRDWAKSAGVKDVNHMAKLLRENMKAVRDSGRIKVPGEGASAEEIATFQKAIGVPEKPEDYKLPVLKDAEGNDVEMNSDKLAAIATIAHKHGIPAMALEATLQEIAEADAIELSNSEGEIQRRAEAHAKKWGDKRAENTANINAAATALGLTREELLAARAAWGPERALDVFAKLGAGISEDTMVDGGTRTRFGVSGAEAQKQLDEKMGDREWAKKAAVPGTPQNAEYERLNNAIATDADRKQVAEA